MKKGTRKMTRGIAITIISIALVVMGWVTYSATKWHSISPNATGQKIANLEYARAGDHALLLDLYLPPKKSDRLPVVVWIHGGYWCQRSKDEDIPALFLLDHGFAVASIDFRQSQQAIFPGQIHDCKAAVRWLRANAESYGLDPDHIGVWGDSSGGHLAALLGTSGGVQTLEGSEGNTGMSSRVQCVCDWYGPADLVEAFTAPGIPENAYRASFVFKLLGGKDRGKAALASPITHVTPDDAPFLIMHGTKDRVVPLAQSRRLKDALKSAGVPVQLVVLPGASHADKAFLNAGNKRTILHFFNRHLK
ncbi:MAG: alpha/beta hydrolase fold domain-containing protein [Armatimonadota bacterium]